MEWLSPCAMPYQSPNGTRTSLFLEWGVRDVIFYFPAGDEIEYYLAGRVPTRLHEYHRMGEGMASLVFR